jgi:hypothetical protein
LIKYYFAGCKTKTQWSCETVSLIEIINGCNWAFEIAKESVIYKHIPKYKLLLDFHYVLTITKISTMSKLEGLLTRRSLEETLVEILDANTMNQRIEAAHFLKRRYSTYLPLHSVTSHKKVTFAVTSVRI